MEINKIFNEDCIKGMANIPDSSIDLIITDPPYKITPRGGCGTMSGYITNDISMKGLVFQHNETDIEQYLYEFYRILKEDAHCYIMCNHLNLPHFFHVIGESKFHFVKLLVWDKQNKICGTYFMGQVEFIFFLRKGKNKPINDCGTSDLLSFSSKKDKDRKGENIHDSQKPVPLMQVLINASTKEGDLVLDPFMGSGTTAIACLKEKRNYIGYELDENFYKRAIDRIDIFNAEPTLF